MPHHESFDDMNNDTSPVGKRAICAVATQPYNYVGVDKLGNQYSCFFCYLKPLLIQGSDGAWRNAMVYEIYYNRDKGYIRCCLDSPHAAGSLISVHIEHASGFNTGFRGIMPRVIHDDGFFELFAFDIFVSQLQNQPLFELPYVPKLPVFVMCLKDDKLCGPLQYEIQSFSPVSVYFTGQRVGCFESKNIWHKTFVVKLSTNTYPPRQKWTSCRHTLCYVNFSQNSVIETISLETNEDFFRRVNKEIPGIKGKPWINKLEDKIQKNKIVEKIRLKEMDRYIQILESIIGQFCLEAAIRDKLIEVLTIVGIEKTVRELTQPRIDEQLSNASQKAQAIVREAENKKRKIEHEIQKLEKIKMELTNEVVFTETYVETELNPALDRLEILIDGVKPLLPLIPWLSRMTESGTLRPTICVSRNGESISDVEYFIEKSLFPLLQQFGLGADKDIARRFHWATVTCRCVLVPTTNWASEYARASGGKFFLLSIQPNHRAGLGTLTFALRDFWQQACTQPNDLFFVMFEGVNRASGSAWFQPWSNVAAGLTDHVYFDDEPVLWSDNIRLFLSFDQSRAVSKKHKCFIKSCGAFIERFNSEHFEPFVTHFEPVEGCISGEAWRMWAQRNSTSKKVDHKGLPEHVPSEWRKSVQSDINHLLHLGLSISEAENIRINLPNTYAPQNTSPYVSNAPIKVAQ